MSYLTVARTIVNFNNENEALDYINDALQYITHNYKNKYSYTFNGQKFNSQIELIQLLINIISKLKVKINNSSIITENFDILDNEEIL
jgi:hypothetical protein